MFTQLKVCQLYIYSFWKSLYFVFSTESQKYCNNKNKKLKEVEDFMCVLKVLRQANVLSILADIPIYFL